MSLYFIKTPNIIKRIFYNYIWSFNTPHKKIYLTFDDGPTPEVTEWVLNTLKEYNAKATFFCIGKNIENNSELFKRIISEGHHVGNHTYSHLNGWKTSTSDFIKDIEKTEQLLFNSFSFKTKLFRPPYGKIRNRQAKKLIQKGYKIIMWDVLSADFDINISNEKCLDNVTENIDNGSLIVFHDSIKALERLKYTLPKTLEHLKKKGYNFDLIS